MYRVVVEVKAQVLSVDADGAEVVSRSWATALKDRCPDCPPFEQPPPSSDEREQEIAHQSLLNEQYSLSSQTDLVKKLIRASADYIGSVSLDSIIAITGPIEPSKTTAGSTEQA